MKKLQETTKITMATVKAFARRNADALYVKEKSSFCGMSDMVEQHDNPEWSKTEYTDDCGYYSTGIQGFYTVGSSRDRFSFYEDETFIGIRVYNCCGSALLAVKKEVIETPEEIKEEAAPITKMEIVKDENTITIKEEIDTEEKTYGAIFWEMKNTGVVELIKVTGIKEYMTAEEFKNKCIENGIDKEALSPFKEVNNFFIPTATPCKIDLITANGTFVFENHFNSKADFYEAMNLFESNNWGILGNEEFKYDLHLNWNDGTETNTLFEGMNAGANLAEVMEEYRGQE